MTTSRTNDGMEVEWTSSSVPVEQLDAVLHRDRNLTLRYAERLLADSEQEKAVVSMSYNPAHVKIVQWGIQRGHDSDTKE